MLPLSHIMRKNQIAYHSYAEDTQIYQALSPNDYSPIDSICQCIDEVIAFGNKDEVLKVNAYLDSRGQTTKNQVKNLGVILETDLSFSSDVKTVTKSAYYHLKNIARIRSFVYSQDLEELVHAFITSRVDYCNVSLQRRALGSLHWLPVTFRIDFKLLVLVYKSLNDLGPKYIADLLTEYKPNIPFRSVGSSQLEIPRVHTKQGESAFSYFTYILAIYLFHFLLCKALWITTVYEMCYINKLALSHCSLIIFLSLVFVYIKKLCMKTRPPGWISVMPNPVGAGCWWAQLEYAQV